MVTHEFVHQLRVMGQQMNNHQKDHNKNEQIANYYYNHLYMQSKHMVILINASINIVSYIAGIDSNMIYLSILLCCGNVKYSLCVVV